MARKKQAPDKQKPAALDKAKENGASAPAQKMSASGPATANGFPSRPDQAFPVVGIGACAGGLSAFEAFFSGMPADADPGMAFVLVQHLAPDHKSILPDDQDVYYRRHKQLFESREPQVCELRLIKPDGATFWAHLEAGAAQGDKGATFCRCVMSDITERKQAEELLRESEERYRTVADFTYDWEYWVSRDGTCRYVSPSCERISGYRADEFLEDADLLENIIHPDDRAKSAPHKDDSWNKYDHGELHEVDFRIIRRDGQVRWISHACQPILRRDGAHLGIRASNRDITERKLAEVVLKQMMAAIEQVGETIVVSDPEGRIQYINPAFTRITGYGRDEALGQNPRTLKSGKQDKEFYQNLWQTITSGRTWSGRMVNKRKNNTFYTEDATISPVLDEKGRIVNYIGVKRDITDRMALEAQFQQAQKMESVGRLAGGVAHDFNNMLGIILGYGENLLEQIHEGDPLRESVKEIMAAGKRSAALTRQILAYARKQMISPRVLDLNDTVEEMLKMLRRLIGEDIHLVWSPGYDLWSVNIDPAQIDQILANLCVNARDAISGVGNVTIRTRNMSLDAAYCAAHVEAQTGNHVMLAVEDDGCGMDRDTLAHLFEPFFTTKEVGEGTGMGLPTVYGIVKQNNGFIEVKSEPGKGTTVAVYLPRIGGEADEEGEADTGEIPRGNGETVLVVEDEAGLLNMAKRMLEGFGYRVLTANTPEEAFSLAERHGDDIRLLMTDVVMPQMNGQELTRRLREANPSLKCLFMSGYTSDIIANRGRLDKAVYFIQKPFMLKELALKVRMAMDSEK